MNYIDKNIKKITHDNTIGIIICGRNNKFIMEYFSDKRILAKEYELVWKKYACGALFRNSYIYLYIYLRISFLYIKLDLLFH